MARYIDLDKLLEYEYMECLRIYDCREIKKFGSEYCAKYCSIRDECFLFWAIRNTEDVAPVVHAKWKILENDYAYDDMFTYECSNCLGELCMTSDDLAPYCHNCGAKMDIE